VVLETFITLPDSRIQHNTSFLNSTQINAEETGQNNNKNLHIFQQLKNNTESEITVLGTPQSIHN